MTFFVAPECNSDAQGDFTKLPNFQALNAKQFQLSIKQTLVKYQKTIDFVCNIEKPLWDNIIVPLDIIEHKLSELWSPIRHLNSVSDNDELREIHNQLKQEISEFYTRLGQNQKLYLLFKQLSEQQLPAIEQKIINDNLLSFKLSGVSLSSDKKQQYQAIQKILTKLSTQFSENILDCTEAWEKLITNPKDLSGIPEHIIELTKEKATKKKKKGWLFTLDFPIYYAVISYSDSTKLREAFYKAYATRSSLAGEHHAKYDNTLIINQILNLKQEKATLLGFDNYSELSITNKMAESPKKVAEFLLDLAEKSKPSAEKDFETLKAFVKASFGIDQLNAWDIPYYSEKLKESLFNINDEMLQPYFPENKVLSGLFSITHKLYGVTIKELPDANVWHKDIKLFKITASNKKTCGYFYLDLYTREGKRGGAWMDECTNRILIDDQQHLPVAYLTCNLTPPIGDKPALFTHDEVVTLFHEFGHGLHHMLSEVDYPSVAGINGVEWDAVELPSQFMENWCWDRNHLGLISGHYKTNEALPSEWLDSLLKAKNFQAGMQMLRQIEFSLFDIEIHNSTKKIKQDFVQKTLDNIRSTNSLIIPPSYNKFQNSFSHIFSGGYAAGYYSYKWAEVLSADAFSAFEKVGLDNNVKIKQTGQSFLKNILQKGGTEPALELFKKFRGRAPDNTALLKQNGIL